MRLCGGRCQRRRKPRTDLVAAHVSKVIVRRDRIEVDLKESRMARSLGPRASLLFRFHRRDAQKGITREPSNTGHIDAVGAKSC